MFENVVPVYVHTPNRSLSLPAPQRSTLCKPRALQISRPELKAVGALYSIREEREKVVQSNLNQTSQASLESDVTSSPPFYYPPPCIPESSPHPTYDAFVSSVRKRLQTMTSSATQPADGSKTNNATNPYDTNPSTSKH
ncbi:hypothetical protein CC2G_009647 [Coprinopsis cinerea AmutBmut pab1-1]|nr:hypothetical protein CC2G_009647 [Coprinopsis cinerea AmutBmut pab1-1]